MVAHLRAQVDAGAHAVQLFDSWVGALDRDDYRRFVFPHTARVFEGIAGASQYFSGPDDPNFGAIKFTCQRVEMLGMSDGMGVDSAEL